jgi:hypothetical protein
MPGPQDLCEPSEISRKGDRIYDAKYRAEYEASNQGKFVAINILDESATLGETPVAALDAAQWSQPSGIFHIIRVDPSGHALKASVDVNQGATPAVLDSSPAETPTPILSRFWRWLKVPSHLLSVIAIVATLVVPAVEKVLKADEELRSKIDSLGEITTRLIGSNYEIGAKVTEATSGLSPEDRFGLFSLEKENNLKRALAIAHSIKHDVYPSILFELANELAITGRFEDAEELLQEVLHRSSRFHRGEPPSVEESFQAHLMLAKMVVAEGQNDSRKMQLARKTYGKELAQALEPDLKNNSEVARTRKAGLLTDWADLDGKVGDPRSAQQHLSQAREIVATLPPNPLLQARLQPPQLAGSTNQDAFSNKLSTVLTLSLGTSNSNIAFLVKPPNLTQDDFSGSNLFIYEGGKLIGVFEPDHWFRNDDGSLAGIKVLWVRTIPVLADGKRTISTEWLIDSGSATGFTGTHAEFGKPPIRFEARILHPTDPPRI